MHGAWPCRLGLAELISENAVEVEHRRSPILRGIDILEPGDVVEDELAEIGVAGRNDAVAAFRSVRCRHLIGERFECLLGRQLARGLNAETILGLRRSPRPPIAQFGRTEVALPRTVHDDGFHVAAAPQPVQYPGMA